MVEGFKSHFLSILPTLVSSREFEQDLCKSLTLKNDCTQATRSLQPDTIIPPRQIFGAVIPLASLIPSEVGYHPRNNTLDRRKVDLDLFLPFY